MEKVIVRRCEEYNKDAIKRIIREGMEELGYRPRCKEMIKPNIVYAHRRVGRLRQTGAESSQKIAGMALG